ncbi:hypothetical protein H5410_039536 [Solanum commersonii]|uniref:Uncharacterized protein n=1 Tax=Solanum commersonii TaxID=4109 RepID=A0A9J5XPU8_SOLCO|nr:hypothetical protein H5410_039536 [Solanum commersonii]
MANVAAPHERTSRLRYLALVPILRTTDGEAAGDDFTAPVTDNVPGSFPRQPSIRATANLPGQHA